jgi:hypothetical protein
LIYCPKHRQMADVGWPPTGEPGAAESDATEFRADGMGIGASGATGELYEPTACAVEPPRLVAPPEPPRGGAP